MIKVLTVDDSRAIRSMVLKQMRELGFECDEAEDGIEGLKRLEECEYELVLLDVTMPNLDGPGMLAKMREAGNRTPVLMLTSESKRSIVTDVMKSGIEDYILKPFKPEDLRAKVLKIVKPREGAAPVVHEAPAPVAARAVAGDENVVATGGAAKQFVDILLVDDMENVHKKLRAMLPAHVSLASATNGTAALTMARDRVCRVGIVDCDIPGLSSQVLVGQLRTLQPHAAFLYLTLRTTNSVDEAAKEQGFDGVLYKPFTPDAIEDFLLQYFDNQELIVMDDEVLKVGGFAGRDDRLERYFSRLGGMLKRFLEQVAAACHERAILELTRAPSRPDRLPKLVVSAEATARKMGLGLSIVGTDEARTVLSSFSDTRAIPFYPTVAAARAAS